MAKRRWSQGAWAYACAFMVLFCLVLSDTSRLLQASQSRGTAGPLWAATSAAAVTGAVLWWLGRGITARHSSPRGNRVRLGAIGLWSLGMFGLLLATHPTYRMRLFSGAFGGPGSMTQFVIVAYQVLIWVAMLVAMAVFAWRWRGAGGFGAESGSRDSSQPGPQDSPPRGPGSARQD